MVLDDRYNKLRRDIGNDFSRRSDGNKEPVTELFSFHCGSCGYRNIHDVKVLTCGCGQQLQGRQVYRKVGDTVIYDTREKRAGRR